MTIFQAILLGLLQGATEFLPISSSGHLVLVPWLLGWKKASLTFDIVVHLGTLVALIIYFRTDLGRVVRGLLISVRDRSLADAEGRLGWLIVLGSIPTAVFGLLFEDFFARLFAGPLIVSSLLLVTGLIVFLSERMSQRLRRLETLGVKDSLLIGLAQVGALAPGISRSGTTIAMGLALNIEREAAARFSFLLALPIILGASLLEIKQALEIGITDGEVMNLGVGFLVAAISGYACIYFLLSYVRRHSLYLFTAYCWLFGIFSLIVFFVRG